MSTVVHTMPALIRHETDMQMFRQCLSSLERAERRAVLVLHNQGMLTNDRLLETLSSFELDTHMIGGRENVGIPAARQACFEYVWEHFPDCAYITEIHPDMLFPADWTAPLQAFLQTRPEEPCVCPGILTAAGEWHPEGKGVRSAAVPGSIPELLALLVEVQREEVAEGFVHPVMHRSEALRTVGGYRLEDLRGKQGYEDDYLLLAYYHELRLPKGWRPKADLRSRVFHYTMAQRMDYSDLNEQAGLNLQGLLRRFGTQGLYDLKNIHALSSFPIGGSV
ncbi:hypothetical protein Elgi_70180 [Paenibacillus elgii]|uniref:hypothetical protein n=1 Tax=Paenibacillus elgii TaxID=189691 RepID=UPI002D7B8892|nr:hypothetical protein Elgi_70180 [Paenibacillus elgii]